MLLFTSFWKTLLTTERRLSEWKCLHVDLFPTFLNTGTYDKTFQQSWKQNFFRHLLKISASMYDSSSLVTGKEIPESSRLEFLSVLIKEHFCGKTMQKMWDKN